MSSGNIKTSGSFKEYFYQKFSQNEEKISLFNQNREKLQKINNIISYEYFDDNDKILKNRYFALTYDSLLYEIDFNELKLTEIDIEFSKYPKVIKVNSMLYFYDTNGVYVFEKDNEPIFIESVVVPKVYEIVNGYLFFSGNLDYPAVFVSDDLNLLNLSNDFENYEKITLDEKYGKLLKLLSVGDKLFIFQEYKISTFDIYAANKKVESEYHLAAKILDGTIQKINDFVIFLTSCGLKTFDGNSLNSAFDEIFKSIVIDGDLFAVVFNGEYYLCINKIIDNKKQPLVYKLNFDGKSFVAYGVEKLPISYFIITNSDEYSLNFVWKENDKSIIKFISNDSDENTKYARFCPIYFSEYENKQIDKMTIFAKGKFNLRIKSDVECHEFALENNTVLQNLSIKGDVFFIEIYSDEAFEIDAFFIKLLMVGDDLWQLV